jgi:hypothetical protein
MELDDFVKVFDRLLPRSRVWNLVFDRPLRRFFHGLSIIPKTIKEYAESILLDAFPQDTDRMSDWTLQFNYPYDLDIDQLLAEWAQFGGQNPKYFQDILHTAGFVTCHVHEWWIPGSNPVVSRNPIELVDTSRVLVNDIFRIEKRYKWQFGDGISQFGNTSISFGDYNGYQLVSKIYSTPDIETEYPNYFYVCGPVWPDYAVIPQSKLRYLIQLIFKLKPMHLRCILRVSTYDDESGDDYDIQDTIDHEIMIQDQIADPSPEETIQDHH